MVLTSPSPSYFKTYTSFTVISKLHPKGLVAQSNSQVISITIWCDILIEA
jgi:hypothetical protein